MYGFNPDLCIYLSKRDRSGTLALCLALPGSAYVVISKG